MSGRHRSSDQPATEARPYCQNCKVYFRRWGRETRKHEKDGHTVVTKLVDTR